MDELDTTNMEGAAGEGGSDSTSGAGALPPVPPPPAAAGTPPPAGGDKPLMTTEQLNERIAQAKRAAAAAERAQLKTIFGTDDPEEIKRIKDEHAKLKEENEKAKRARMSREQQLEADLKAERAEKAQLAARLKDAQEARLYDKQDAIVTRLASQHVADKFTKFAAREFGEHLLTLPKRAVERMTDADIAKWFAKFAKDNPELAKAANGGAPRQQVRKPVTTGKPEGNAGKPSPAGASAGQKTIRPGQPNSMSRPEALAAMKRQGFSY